MIRKLTVMTAALLLTAFMVGASGCSGGGSVPKASTDKAMQKTPPPPTLSPAGGAPGGPAQGRKNASE